jgi:predicted O-methyltransferase YrrM
MSHPRLTAGRVVVELGAGLGISAAVMSRPPAAPADLTLTDGTS